MQITSNYRALKRARKVLLALGALYAIYFAYDFFTDYSLNNFTLISLFLILSQVANFRLQSWKNAAETARRKERRWYHTRFLLLVYFLIIATALLLWNFPWQMLFAALAYLVLFVPVTILLIYCGLIAIPGASKTLQQVQLGAAAPKNAIPGELITARFLAYVPSIEKKVQQLVRQASPRSAIHSGYVSCKWQKNAKLKVIFTTYPQITQPITEHFVWNAKYKILDFHVPVPKDFQEEWLTLKFEVYMSDIRVAVVTIEVSIKATASSSTVQISTAKPYSKAFASYASADRDIVLHRVSEIQRNGISVFLDCMSMQPGEIWKQKVEDEIKGSDAFLLFWSPQAKDSEWVTWEWKTALQHRGSAYIELHPLTTPDLAPPPDELKHLHFGDIFMEVATSLKARQGRPRK